MMQASSDRSTARPNSHAVTRAYAQVFSHPFGVIVVRIGPGVRGYHTINIFVDQTSILEPEATRLCIHLCCAQVWHFAHLSLTDACNCHSAPQTCHLQASLIAINFQ